MVLKITDLQTFAKADKFDKSLKRAPRVIFSPCAQTMHWPPTESIDEGIMRPSLTKPR
jgi:hypothetical protein